MKLKELRIKKQKKQKDVAADLNIVPQTYNRYESGQILPPIDTLIKLADYFEVSVDYLVGHNVPGLIEMGYLTPEQKSFITMVTRLNQLNFMKAQAYVGGLLASQN